MLRKAIADHCFGHVPRDTLIVWPAEARNGHVDGEINLEPSEKITDREDRIEMLRRQVGKLKEAKKEKNTCFRATRSKR